MAENFSCLSHSLPVEVIICVQSVFAALRARGRRDEHRASARSQRRGRRIPPAAGGGVICAGSTASAAQRHSLDNQHETYRRLIAQTPAWTYAGAYTDAAVSGTKVSARSGFLRMIADAEAGRFDMIVVKDDCVIIEPTQKDLENQGSVAGSVCFLTRNKEIFIFIT